MNRDSFRDSTALRITIKKALISGIILLQFITLTTLLISNYLSSQRSFNSHANKLMIDFADNVMDNSKRFLNTAQSTTTLTAELLELGVLSIDDPADLTLYFYQQLKQSPNLSGIYLGTINGDFVHVQREQGFEETLFTRKLVFDAKDNTDGNNKQVKRSDLYTHNQDFVEISHKRIETENYDPRDRIWFNKALQNKTLSWTDPYIFFSSRKPGITSSMPIYDKEHNIVGVVGVDVSLANISSFFNKLNLGEDSTAFVTNRLGEIIAYPDQDVIKNTASESLRFPRINEIDNPVALMAWQTLQDNKYFVTPNTSTTDIKFSYEGKNYHAVFKEFTHHKWPWLIAIYMPEEFFLAELIANQKLNILIGLFISLIACIASFLFISHITDSLRKIRIIADNIRCGKFIKSNITDAPFIELKQTQYAFNDMIDSLISSRRENEVLHAALEKMNIETITRLGIAAEYKNDSSPNHVRRVSRYCELIALNMGMPREKAKDLRAASKLHNLGKIGIPDHILSKRGALSKNEWKIMKTAPVIGAKILQDAESETLKTAHDIVLTLHENWDGSGYPNQLCQHEIPLSARIVAVVDTFDTIIHDRCYRSPIAIEEAINQVRQLSGHKFDPAVVAAFDNCLMDILNIYKELSPIVEIQMLSRQRQKITSLNN